MSIPRDSSRNRESVCMCVRERERERNILSLSDTHICSPYRFLTLSGSLARSGILFSSLYSWIELWGRDCD